jgi:hypothetical protein
MTSCKSWRSGHAALLRSLAWRHQGNHVRHRARRAGAAVSDCALQMSFTSGYQIYAQPISLLHDA